MSMFDKLKFWKKDDLDFDELVKKDMGHDDNFGMGEQPQIPGQPLQDDMHLGGNSPFEQDPLASQPFSPQQDQDHPLQKLTPQPAYSPTKNNDLELINSKLDTIKAMLNSIEQRLGRLERQSLPEKQQNLW
ncbi:MAG TPA: hypothetical protein VJI15_04070 [Candidatus Nanoarchaeia archaeon]|nr:hypothetical protein [Candidatus Nanoarchaeia archaeon]